MLLLSSGMSFDSDTKALQRLQSACEVKIKGITDGFADVDSNKRDLDFSGLSCGSVFTLASALVNLASKPPVYGAEEDSHLHFGTGVIMFILQTLTRLEDFRALVGYCHTVVKLENMHLIVCVTAILGEQLDVVLAIPTGADLPRLVLDRYCICRASCPPSRMVVEPLLEIFTRMNVQGQIIVYLKHEMILWEQTFAVMACSPLSDFQPETARPTSSLLDELEYIVAQNPILDEQSIKHLLAAVSPRLGELEYITCIDKAALAALCSRVKTPLVDQVTRAWLQDQLATNPAARSANVLVHLVQVHCANVNMLHSAVISAYEIVRPSDSETAIRLVATLLETMSSLSRPRHTEATEMASSSSRAAQLAQTIARILGANDVAMCEAVFSRTSFVAAFSKVLVEDGKMLEEALDVDSLLYHGNAASNIRALALALLDPFRPSSNHMRLSAAPASKLGQDIDDDASMAVIDQALCTVDSISLPVYHFALSCLTKVCSKRELEVQSLRSSIVRAVEKAMATENTDWLRLLSVLDSATLGEVNEVPIGSLWPC
jgi:hypothetical protein